MKLEFDNYPLNTYNQPLSRRVLKTIGWSINQSYDEQSSLGSYALSSIIKKASGAGLLTLIDDVSIGFQGEKARRCLSNLVREQVNNVVKKTSSLLLESQFNLMATSCITSYLCSLESSSWSNGVKNLGKLALGLLSFEDPRNVIYESVKDMTDKYDNICQIYHIAFLLEVYNSSSDQGEFIKKLITESLCNDSGGEKSILSKKRPILFSDVQYKSLEDNIKNRDYFLKNKAIKYEELYNTFVKWRMDNPL